MMLYTGIGSRRMPPAVGRTMTRLAMDLSLRGWVLRSGGADGADCAFEEGANEKEIYLPWCRFNGNGSPLWNVTAEAIEESLKFHQAPERIQESDAVKKLMGRNLYQVLGRDLQTPSRFVVCWTPFPTEYAFDPEKRIGGTGQALRIARHHGIPIYNLREAGALERLGGDLLWLESLTAAPKQTP